MATMTKRHDHKDHLPTYRGLARHMVARHGWTWERAHDARVYSSLALETAHAWIHESIDAGEGGE